MRGMDHMTRRDFVNGALLGSGAMLLNPASPVELLARATVSGSGPSGPGDDDWTGYGGVGEYASSNGNTAAVLQAGHRISRWCLRIPARECD